MIFLQLKHVLLFDVLLGVRADLRACARPHMLPYFLPVFAEQLDRLQKSLRQNP